MPGSHFMEFNLVEEAVEHIKACDYNYEVPNIIHVVAAIKAEFALPSPDATGDEDAYLPLETPAAIHMLCSAFQEMLKNSIDAKATHMTIDYEVDVATKKMIVTVKDNGKGFAAKFLQNKDENSFGAYLEGSSKIVSSKTAMPAAGAKAGIETKEGGSGFGLAWMTHILKVYGGELIIGNTKDAEGGTAGAVMKLISSEVKVPEFEFKRVSASVIGNMVRDVPGDHIIELAIVQKDRFKKPDPVKTSVELLTPKKGAGDSEDIDAGSDVLGDTPRTLMLEIDDSSRAEGALSVSGSETPFMARLAVATTPPSAKPSLSLG